MGAPLAAEAKKTSPRGTPDLVRFVLNKESREFPPDIDMCLALYRGPLETRSGSEKFGLQCPGIFRLDNYDLRQMRSRFDLQIRFGPERFGDLAAALGCSERATFSSRNNPQTS